jgi:hypothetical protein
MRISSSIARSPTPATATRNCGKHRNVRAPTANCLEFPNSHASICMRCASATWKAQELTLADRIGRVELSFMTHFDDEIMKNTFHPFTIFNIVNTFT